MIIIPAIDIKGGKVVRLGQGRADMQTTYSDSPLKIAQKWDSLGVKLIHIVDLDGAFEGKIQNLDVIEEIARKVKSDIEVGGGIRDEATIRELFESGVDKVVIGTKALDEKFLKDITGKFDGRIVVGIDARDGIVHTQGWIAKTRTRVIELAEKVEAAGIGTINYTDISKDGMLEGPNIESLKSLLHSTNINIVAAGGISSLDDIKRLVALKEPRLAGVIIGKALYEGKVELKEAMRLAEVQ